MTNDGSNNKTRVLMASVLMVCFSNKCRSPIASAVFNSLVKSRGLDSRWYSDSAGIAVNISKSIDTRSMQVVLRPHGIDLTRHETRKVIFSDFEKFDHMLGIDEYSVEYLQYLQLILQRVNRLRGNKTKVELLSTYDPEGLEPLKQAPTEDCARPEIWYEIAYRACNTFLDKMSSTTKD